jgi:hypothetical protein
MEKKTLNIQVNKDEGTYRTVNGVTLDGSKDRKVGYDQQQKSMNHDNINYRDSCS